MNALLIYVNQFFELTAAALGVILMFKARDNRIMFWWGALTTITGLMLFADDLKWLVRIYSSEPIAINTLIPFRMLKWLTMALLISLFPMAALRPGYITPLRVTVLLIPMMVMSTAVACYHIFAIATIPLGDFSDIVANISALDVKFRLGLFVFSVAVPVGYITVPFIIRYPLRKPSIMMWLFIAALTVEIACYAIFSLDANLSIFYVYGIVMMAFYIVLSTFFLFSENPFSLRITPKTTDTPEEQSIEGLLFATMEEYFSRNSPYTAHDYTIERMAGDMNSRPSLVANAIRCGGFTGFREYMNHLKIEHFKACAQQDRGKTIKELMSQSGFNSRSTFYRLFSEHENKTPTEYIDRLYRS